MIGVAASVVWLTINKASEVIADNYVDRMIARGFPTIWTPHLYWSVRVLAFFTMLVAWVLLAHITVWIWKLIF
jgi:hypothetical protein